MSIPWSFSSGPWTVVVVAGGVDAELSSVEWTLVAVEWMLLVGNESRFTNFCGPWTALPLHCAMWRYFKFKILKFSTFPLKF